MSREIKFRAWSGKQMFSHEDFDGLAWHHLRGEFDELTPFTFGWEDDSFEEGYKLMQYTGLKDKNGKEIYEGDIVRRKSSNNVIEIVAVEYLAPAFNIGNFVPEYGYTVIGNVWENPELLA